MLHNWNRHMSDFPHYLFDCFYWNIFSHLCHEKDIETLALYSLSSILTTHYQKYKVNYYLTLATLGKGKDVVLLVVITSALLGQFQIPYAQRISTNDEEIVVREVIFQPEQKKIELG